MVIQMFYDLETDGKNHYLLTFAGSQPEIPDNTIPDGFDDYTDSFSFETPKPVDRSLLYNSWDSDMSFMERMARGIREPWCKIFNHVLFVPILRIGNVVGPIDKTKLTPLMIFESCPKGVTTEDWSQAITSTTKLSFYDVNTFTFTTSHSVARKLLHKYDYNQMIRKQKNDKYNLVSRMHHWYKNETDGLMTEAKSIIHDFVVTKKYNSRIPDFLVIPAFHIGRYKKATELLLNKYNPHFLMTLPMVYQNKHWTIMFPVMAPDLQLKQDEDV